MSSVYFLHVVYRYPSCNRSYWVVFHLSFSAFCLFISLWMSSATISLIYFWSLLYNLITATFHSVAYALYVFNVTCILYLYFKVVLVYL
jgi:hypothetical protein